MKNIKPRSLDTLRERERERERELYFSEINIGIDIENKLNRKNKKIVIKA